MKLSRFNELCRELHESYGCDPGSLYLTAASHQELSEDMFDSLEPYELESLDTVGVRVERAVNPVTRTSVYIDRSEDDRDYFLTRVYV